MFLNISPTVAGWNATSDEFSLIFENNPVAEFVELPDHCYNLRYANILVPDMSLFRESLFKMFLDKFSYTIFKAQSYDHASIAFTTHSAFLK
jgi:hypothetical protein